jgi:hypothetical protein
MKGVQNHTALATAANTTLNRKKTVPYIRTLWGYEKVALILEVKGEEYPKKWV